MLNPNDKAMRVKQVYSELDRKFEERETEKKALKLGVPYLNLYGFPLDMQALRLLSRDEAETLGAVVFFKEGRSVKIGILDLASKAKLKKKLDELGYTSDFFLIS